jgi:hypothetical protein
MAVEQTPDCAWRYTQAMSFEDMVSQFSQCDVPVCRSAAPKIRLDGPDLRPVGLQAGMSLFFAKVTISSAWASR